MQNRRHSLRSRVRRRRQLQGDNLHSMELIQEEIDNVRLHLRSAIHARELAGMYDEFLQERRHVHHTTASRQVSDHPRTDIQRSHRDGTRHRDAVRCLRRYPHRSPRRHYPCPIERANRHHTSNRIDQLVFRMEMLRNDMPVIEVIDQCRER